MCLKEILQDPDDKWGQHLNPHTRNQDIGSCSQAGYALYSCWRKFRLSGPWAQARVITRFFSSQVVALVSPFINLVRTVMFTNILFSSACQLAVHNHS